MVKHSIIFVTSYPEKGEIHSATTVGVASYAKQLAVAMRSQNKELDIEVIAEKLSNNSESYVEQGITVKRVWQRGSISSVMVLLVALFRSKQTKILVSIEINMLGGIAHTLSMLLGLAAMRLFGKEIILIAHQVPSRVTAGVLLHRLGWYVGVSGYFILVKLAGTKIVVFEQYLADLLDSNKTLVIPHALPETKNLSKAEARTRIGWEKNETYALCLGYIAPYKGLLRLVKNWNNRDAKLVVAGGINPNHTNNQKIKDYVSQVMQAAERRDIEVTGFVQEDLLGLYFAASDVVLLPYKMMFSSSGPLAWGMAYHKPVLLSQELKDYLRSKDLSSALEGAGIDTDDMIVDFDKDCSLVIERAIEDREKWQKFGGGVQKTRNWPTVAQRFWEVVDEK